MSAAAPGGLATALPPMLDALAATLAVTPGGEVAIAGAAPVAASAAGAALRDHLYARWFCRWQGPEAGAARYASGDAAFVATLAAAAAGHFCWEPGWQVVEAGPGWAFVTDGQVTLYLEDLADLRAADNLRAADDLRAAADGSPLADGGAPADGPAGAAPGTPVALRLPCARPGLAPGFFYLVGPGGPIARAAPFVRIYLNVLPAAAPDLVGALLARLGAAGVPFEAKVANDPARYGRVDPAVVYVAPAGFRDARVALEALAAERPAWLRPEVPAFTRPLAPGLAAAESPAGAAAESFGQHRCRLVAEGVLAGLVAGERGGAAWLPRVVAAFAAAGVDPERPWLATLPPAWFD